MGFVRPLTTLFRSPHHHEFHQTYWHHPDRSGCLGLVYGGFSYTKETTGVKLGPIELKIQEKERVNVPLLLSAAGIALGVFLLVAGARK